MYTTHGWLYEMWYPENIGLVYPHRISYAWQRLPLLKVERPTIIWSRLNIVCSQLPKGNGHTWIHHFNIPKANNKCSRYGGQSIPHSNY
jgi:hypothetical protein